MKVKMKILKQWKNLNLQVAKVDQSPNSAVKKNHLAKIKTKKLKKRSQKLNDNFITVINQYNILLKL